MSDTPKLMKLVEYNRCGKFGKRNKVGIYNDEELHI